MLEDNSLMFGGGKGGGKSMAMCQIALMLCFWIIEHCQIENPAYPVPVGFLGRKTAVDFKNTTLATWKKTINPNFYRIKGNPAEIIIDDKVSILTGGLDNSDTVNKFNSAELFFFGIDQAEETTQDDVSVLRGSLRATYNGKHIPYKEIYSTNPAECWLKNDFITAPQPKHYFIQALYSDNPYLPEGYVDTLEKSFKHRKGLLYAYRDGDWDSFETDKQVIKGTWINSAKQRSDVAETKRVYLSVDPAEFGNDESAIYLMCNTCIVDEWFYGQKEPMWLANRVAVLSKQNGNCAVVIDDLGVGSGVASRLRELGIKVIGVRNSEKADNSELYYNKRAEVHDTVAIAFSEGDIVFNSDDPTLRSQMCIIEYDYRNGRMLIEPKEKIREKLGGKSPDRSDTYFNGVYVYLTQPESLAPGIVSFDYDRFDGYYAGSAMAC